MKLVKTILLASTLSFVLSLYSTTAFAATGKKEEKVAEKFFDSEFNAEIKAYKTTEDGLVPLTKEEYDRLTQENEDLGTEFTGSNSNLKNSIKSVNKVNNNSLITPMDIYYEYWKYFESSVTKYTGDPIKVTATIDCTTSGGCSISKAVSATVSASYSVSGANEIAAIKAGASFTWVNSATNTSTYTFSLAKGESGYIAFKPTKRKSTGTLKKYSNESGYLYSVSAYGRSAVKLSNGEADGIFTFVYN